MPLTSDPNSPIVVEDGAAIWFQMFDEDNNRVRCRVSWEALEDKDSGREPSETFQLHRGNIECVASALFDGGDLSPFVTTALLN